MSLIRDMKALDGFNNIEKSDDQISSQRLSNEKEKLMRNDLLRIVNGNAMLRASLILLTIVMIFFTVMKICKLFYQIRHHHQRKQEVNEFDSETPQVLVKTHSADYPFSANKKWNKKKHRLARTSRVWKAKSNLDSNSLPSREMKLNILLSNESNSKQAKSKKIYPTPESSLKSTTKGAEKKDSDTTRTMACSAEGSAQTGIARLDSSNNK